MRVDTGVREGDAVSMFYDPMIAKVIAYDATRKAAAAKLAGALAKAEVAGVRTNNAFLIRALSDADFVAGEIDTGFIDRKGAALISHGVAEEVLGAAAAFVARTRRQPTGDDPWGASDGFRIGGRAQETVDFVLDGKRRAVAVPDGTPGIAVLRLANGTIAAIRDGETFELTEYDPLASAEIAGEAADRIVTPMPGKVARVLVKEGERVVRGQAIAVLEAMKMEHTLASPGDLEIESVAVAAGDQVGEGTIVVRFKPEKKAA